MVRLLCGLARHDVLFIDEIHDLPTPVAEVLYEALTDRRLSLPVFSGAHVRTLVLRLEPFTLMGATTDEGELTEAFLSRFEHFEHLRFYNQRELAEIISRASVRENVTIDCAAAALLASVSRGTPRVALRLFRQARGQAIAVGCRHIDEPIAEAALARLDTRWTGSTWRSCAAEARAGQWA
jgi:Holliday junction DNA helicase RuvB